MLERDGEHHRVCFNGAPRDGLARVTSQQSLGEAEGAECVVVRGKSGPGEGAGSGETPASRCCVPGLEKQQGALCAYGTLASGRQGNRRNEKREMNIRQDGDGANSS